MSPSLNPDAWRGGLALTVAAAHVAQIYDPVAHPAFGWAAFAAVQGFFVISGYLIAQSLKNSDWRRFAIRRVNRLLPPFLCSLALCGVLWLIAPLVFPNGTHSVGSAARASFSMEGLLPTAFFLNGFLGPTLDSNGPLWSLSYEVWYYVIAALAVYRQRFLAIALLLVLTVLQPWFAIKGLAWAAGFAAGWFVPVKNHHQGAGRLAQVGRFSYTLYVTHFPILLFCFGAGVPALLGAAIAFMFAAIVGPRIEPMRLIRHHRYSTPTRPFTTSAVPTNLSISGDVT